VWASGEWNPARSVKLETLAPLFEFDDFEFWNLQGGPIRDEWEQLRGSRANLHDHSMLRNAGLAPLAAFIAQLDLVITVDTLAAHLAGTLDIPCFLMFQHAADWRWMIGRVDSPWYPSMRLFRQPLPGDWSTVVRNLKAMLGAWADSDMRSVA
jgi:hypothetical protein